MGAHVPQRGQFPGEAAAIPADAVHSRFGSVGRDWPADPRRAGRQSFGAAAHVMMPRMLRKLARMDAAEIAWRAGSGARTLRDRARTRYAPPRWSRSDLLPA